MSVSQAMSKLHDSYLIKHFNQLRYDNEVSHYTNIDAMQLILKHQSIRFTNILYLNDPSELIEGINIAKRVFEKLLQKIGFPEKALSTIRMH